MDATVAAVPVYFGTMGAEHLWLRAQPDGARRRPTTSATDTITSLAMGVGSLARADGRAEAARPDRARARASTARRWSSTRLGRGGGHDRRRPRRPPRTVRRRRRRSRWTRRRLGPRAPPGGSRASEVRSRWRRAASRSPPRWASRTTADRMWNRRHRARPRPRAGCAGRGHPRLGLHLLLEPPVHAREPLHVGHPRGAPLERALQPVDRAAAAGGRRARHLRALQPAGAARHAARADRAGPRHQPALPVLDPHRHDPATRPVREGRSTRRRTTGCTTAATSSTSTATTAAS